MSQQIERPRQRRGPSWLPAAIVLLCSAVFGYAVLPHLARRVSPAGRMLGTQAPDFSLPVLQGAAGSQRAGLGEQGRISLSGLAGNVVVLDFWASWCKPCVAQARILSQLAPRYANDKVVFVGINTADSPDNAESFAEAHQLPYPSVYDTGEVADAYGAQSLPTLIVIDAKGRVSQAGVGVVGASELESAIAEAAQAQP
jgi:thiol-disulfide isomerase/thioredoxin